MYLSEVNRGDSFSVIGYDASDLINKNEEVRNRIYNNIISYLNANNRNQNDYYKKFLEVLQSDEKESDLFDKCLKEMFVDYISLLNKVIFTLHGFYDSEYDRLILGFDVSRILCDNGYNASTIYSVKKDVICSIEMVLNTGILLTEVGVHNIHNEEIS